MEVLFMNLKMETTFMTLQKIYLRIQYSGLLWTITTRIDIEKESFQKFLIISFKSVTWT